MKLLWIFLVIPTVLGQVNFGTPYFKNSLLCHSWNCLNTKLGLPNTLPSRNVTEDTLKRILPQGPWQDVVGKVLDSCYGSRTRRYTNTCPGQALFHCIVDQMTEFCPEESVKKADACSPVSSLAGLKYMFSQSRYYNLEVNLPKERRPQWFLTNYFDQKCCDLPMMFNTTVLQECGFTALMSYYNHELRYGDVLSKTTPAPTTPRNEDVVRVVDLNQMPKVTAKPDPAISNTDPLDCCDIKEFIEPAWRSECGFSLSWQNHERLVIANNTPVFTTESPLTTTTARTDPVKDLMLLPQACDEVNCVFRQLGVIDSGGINTLAFMKMLDNFTNLHPTWKKATARVVTKCLSRKVLDYDGMMGCEINKVLACTLDILTENCPYKRKIDNVCRHHKQKTGCQISASKLRPKNRREICLLPQLVSQDVLHQCGLDSLYKAEFVVVPDVKAKKTGWAPSNHLCEDQKPSTTCLLSKMGILNKYKFMDYFGMKNKIRQFMENQTVWAASLDIYMSAFINIPLYQKHCSSQKKLLNVVDAMMMTCPISKRVNSRQCLKFFKDMSDATTATFVDPKFSKTETDKIVKHFHSIFLPKNPITPKFDRAIRRNSSLHVSRKPIYNYGVLDSKSSPKVDVIAVKPSTVPPSTNLVVFPQGLLPQDHNLQLATPFHNDGILRGNPFWLQDRIASGHYRTVAPNKPTVYPIPTNVPSTTAKISTTIPTFREPAWKMIKPE